MKTAVLGSLAIASLALASCASVAGGGGGGLAYNDLNHGYYGPFHDGFWGGDGGLTSQYGLGHPFNSGDFPHAGGVEPGH
jgi:hypothetical protein